jgi:hypothetical protein
MAEPRDTGADIAKAVREALAQAGEALGRAGEVASSAIEGALASRGSGAREDLSSEVLNYFEQLDVLAAGEEDSVRIELSNPGENATEPFALSGCELKSSGGDTIPASAVVVPDHQRVLAAGLTDSVPVTVKVPAGTKPGSYTGEVQGGPKPAPISVEVR